ncbi:MAG: phage tail tube protein [Campylobacterota bacterium]|nr:phage tail tube protein [Campylobacterota bacterium]
MQTQGSSSRIAFGYEATYGTVATAMQQVSVIPTVSLKQTQNLNDSAVIRGTRDMGEAFLGFKSAEASMSIPLDSVAVGDFFKMSLGTSSAPADNGDGTFTHTFTRNDTTLPSVSLELAHTDISKYKRGLGFRANTMNLSFGDESEQKLDLGFMGKSVSNEVAEIAVPTAVASSIQYEPFEISISGFPTLSIKTGSLSFTNNLDGGQYVVGSNGEVADIPAGMIGVSGSFTCLYDENIDAIQASAASGTVQNMSIDYSDGTNAINFVMQEVKLNAETGSEVTSPLGQEATFNFNAFWKSGVNNSALTIVVTNDKATAY